MTVSGEKHLATVATITDFYALWEVRGHRCVNIVEVLIIAFSHVVSYVPIGLLRAVILAEQFGNFCDVLLPRDAATLARSWES